MCVYVHVNMRFHFKMFMTEVSVNFQSDLGGMESLVSTQYCVLSEGSVGEELPPVNLMSEYIM